MGYTFKEYDPITLDAGDLTVTMFYDSSITITHPDDVMFREIGEFAERVEIATGATEMPEVSITVAEDYTNYSQGYWYKLFNDSVDKEQVRFLFELNEGSGDVWMFDGYVDLVSVQVDEDYVDGSTHRRSFVTFTVYSRLKKLEEATVSSWVADLLTNWAVDEAPLAQVSNLTLTPSTDNNTPYSYRVAARNATDEFVWCDEVTTNDGPTALGGGEYVNLSWDAVSGAAEYAVYRTQNAGTYTNCGLISITVATSLSDTDLSLIEEGTTQLRRTCRQFVRVTDLFRSALSAGLGLTSAENNVTLDTHDIQFLKGSTEYTPDETWVLFSKNYGNLAAPNWGRADYFAADNQNFFGLRHQNLLALIGALATQFGYYIRYNSTPSIAASIEMLTRGRVGSTITLDGELVQSHATITSPVVAKTIRVFRVQDDTEVWLSAANLNEYDMDLGVYFGVYDSDQPLEDFEYLYEQTVDGALISYDEMDGVEFYDYDTPGYVEAETDYRMQEALGLYYFDLSYRKRRDYRRTYTSVRSSGSHVGVKVLARTEISDGITTRTFYANEVRKDIVNNALSVQWIQQ